MLPSPTPELGIIPGREDVWGFQGTGAFPKIGKSAAPNLYVDGGHAEASDNNTGQSPLAPFATVQAAVDSILLEDYSTIFVNGFIEESVVGPDWVTGPNYVSLIGIGPTRYLYWQSAAIDEIGLDLRATGWRVSGFRFYGQAQAACVELRHTDSGANDTATRTVIDNCYFDGATTGRYGILSHGGWDNWIINCTFALWHNAVGGGAIPMWVTGTPLAIPLRNHIKGNLFYDCDNGCVWPSNGSYFYDNMFQPTGLGFAMTQVLNTSTVVSGGDDNVVFNNTFPGDYSIVGGYRGGANDAWLGNWADDIAEAEVSTAGITILAPT